MTVSKNKIPPYVSFKTFQTFLEFLSQGMPYRIDRSVWVNRFSGSNGTQLMTAIKFFQLIEKHPAIIIGGMPILRNGDVHYQFRQISNFYYLTGFDFPNAIAVFIPGKKNKYVLFAEIYDQKKILWEGESYNAKELAQRYKADAVYDIKDFAEKISPLMQNNKNIFSNIEIDNQHAQLLKKLISKRSFNNKKIKIDNPITIFSKMRTYKSEDEIILLKKAISITNQALLKTTKNMKAGMY